MKLSLSTLLVLLAFTAMTQVSLVNRSLTDDTLSILYDGIDNEIGITGYSMTRKNSVNVTSGSVHYLNPTTYLVRTGSDSAVAIRIMEKNKIVFSRQFTVRSIPDPIAVVGDIRDTAATVQQVLASGMLRLEFPRSYYRHSAMVNSFDVTIIKGDSSMMLRSTHYIFPPEMTKAFSELVPGNLLIFDNIRMTQPDGRTRKLPPFHVRII